MITQDVLKAKMISTSACSTIYEVDGHKIELWIITGGTPALGFSFSSFQQRFPVVEKYVDDHWIILKDSCPENAHYNVNHWNKEQKCFDHQIGQNPVIGPTPEEVFTDGWVTFWTWYYTTLPAYELCRERQLGLLHNNIMSGYKLDREEHTKVRAELDAYRDWVSPVTFSSKIYGGRCDEKIVFFSAWWKKAQELFNPLADAHKKWNELTEAEYQELKAHIEIYK
jgi:hypothetical protein